MLAHTFCHIPRISLQKEKGLWSKGILTWADYKDHVSEKNREHLDASFQHLERRQAAYFANSMSSDQHWRLFGDFRKSVAYVDIETTGYSNARNDITTIALFDGKEARTYVRGHNLNQFQKDIQDYKLIVTYNGKTFDVPILEKSFGVSLTKAHIDLRYVLRRLGYVGGLKKVEKQAGIDRGDLRDVDGFFAVLLWQEYKRWGNEAALETLLAYNCADVINLEQLMIMAYNLNLKETPFERALEIPKRPIAKIPFSADTRLISRLMPHSYDHTPYHPSMRHGKV